MIIDFLKRMISADPQDEGAVEKYLRELDRNDTLSDFISNELRQNDTFLELRKNLFRSIPHHRIYLIGSQVYQRIVKYFHNQENYTNSDWDFLVIGCVDGLKIDPKKMSTKKLKFDVAREIQNYSLKVNHSTRLMGPPGAKVDIVSECDVMKKCPVPSRDKDLVVGRYMNRVPLNIQSVAFDISNRRLYHANDAVRAAYTKKVKQISFGCWEPQHRPLLSYFEAKMENLPGFEFLSLHDQHSERNRRVLERVLNKY